MMNFLLDRVRHQENELVNCISSRTVLYNLKPMGLGTPYIESLTSYISRLAKNHNVRVSTLINEVIGPHIQLAYLAEKFSKGLVPNRYNLINGISTINTEFVNVLENLTGRSDIQHMSFKNWEGILSTNIVVKNRRWCPACLEQWKEESNEIYEPLIWSVSSVEKCDIHNIRLKEQCPNCKKELSFVHRNSIVGYCQYCSEWLGERASSIKKDSLSDYELFIITNYKQLLKNGPSLTSFPSKNFISLLLPKLMEGLELNQVLDFALFLDVRYAGLIDWMKNRHLPNPDALLSICYKVDKTIYNLILLSNDPVDYIPFNGQIARKKATSKNQIEKHLLNALSADSPRSLEGICQELGVTSQVAKVNFPGLSRKIRDNHSTFKKQSEIQEQKRIGTILNMSLNMNIPQSLKKSLEDHNISYKAAKRHQPLLCEQIVARYKDFVNESKNKRIGETKQEIKKAIHELHNMGIYPSVPQIAKRLPCNNPNIFRQKTFNDFRKSILLNLGYKV
jgi:hypothetical protein